MTFSKLNTEDLLSLGAVMQNPFVCTAWLLGFPHPWANKQ
jgi:hypothetical protein